MRWGEERPDMARASGLSNIGKVSFCTSLSNSSKEVCAISSVSLSFIKLYLMIALSVKQPYAELIISGLKSVEYRTINTNIRGRILIYASKSRVQREVFDQFEISPTDCLFGMVIGSVEIVDVEFDFETSKYLWKLQKAKKLECPYKPDQRPQPVWFYPLLTLSAEG